MEITQAQKDVRDTFLGGFTGQLVSAVLWGTSAAACTWHSLHLGEIILVLGGFLIFPVTQLLLRSLGHAYALPKGHPMNALAIQIAFTLPLTLPVVIGLGLSRMGLAAGCAGSGARMRASSSSPGLAADEKKATGSFPTAIRKLASAASFGGGGEGNGRAENSGSFTPAY